MILTRYAMRSFEVGEEFLSVAALPCPGFFQPLTDSFAGVGTCRDIEKPLIRHRILHNCFRLALDSKHNRPLVLLELLHEQARVTPESRHGMNVFCDVHHGNTFFQDSTFYGAIAIY